VDVLPIPEVWFLSIAVMIMVASWVYVWFYLFSVLLVPCLLVRSSGSAVAISLEKCIGIC